MSRPSSSISYQTQTSLPLTSRYIATHFKGRAGWDDKEIRHVLLLLLHIGGLTGRRLLILCSVAPLQWFWCWCVSSTKGKEGRKEKGVLYSPYQTLCASVFVSLSPQTHQLSSLSLSSRTRNAHAQTQVRPTEESSSDCQCLLHPSS